MAAVLSVILASPLLGDTELPPDFLETLRTPYTKGGNEVSYYLCILAGMLLLLILRLNVGLVRGVLTYYIIPVYVCVYMFIVHWAFFVRESGVITIKRHARVQFLSRGTTGRDNSVSGSTSIHFIRYYRDCSVICGASVHIILRVGVSWRVIGSGARI